MLALHSRLGSNWEPWTLHHRGIQRQEVIPDKPGVYEIGFLVPFSPGNSAVCAIKFGSSKALRRRFRSEYLRKSTDGLIGFESFEELGLTMAYRCSLGNQDICSPVRNRSWYCSITYRLIYLMKCSKPDPHLTASSGSKCVEAAIHPRC